MSAAAKYMDTADVAKRIRRELKASFPDTRFRVRTRRYAGGSSVDVSWTDGPTDREVNRLIGRYQGKGFDGMTDSSYYREPIRVDGELVQTTCWVGTHRDHSPLAVAKAINGICKRWGVDPAEIRLNDNGWPKDGTGDRIFMERTNDWLSTHVHQWLERSGRYEDLEAAS